MDTVKSRVEEKEQKLGFKCIRIFSLFANRHVQFGKKNILEIWAGPNVTICKWIYFLPLAIVSM